MSRHDEVEQQARYAGLSAFADDWAGKTAYSIYRGEQFMKTVVGSRGALLWLHGYLAGKQAP